ncbi:MAG: DUF885 domain-containing protein [Firmicutes bacterium]|nr:DUF885 domain-containing protein [Alicyclobacillaceae bacterium]MCL6496889.1 DUF885 domain-containing protein [Bacillota bacterium]
MSRPAPFAEGLPRHPRLRALAEEAIAAAFARYPFWATDLGLHEWDDQMPEPDSAAEDALARRLRQVARELEAMASVPLDAEERADWTTLRHAVGALVAELDEDRPAARDPNWYNGIISQSALGLARRRFGSPRDRAAALVARLQAVPALLDRAARRIQNPPAVWVAIARPQYAATIPFLREGLAQAFSDHPNEAQAVAEAGAEAARAYERFLTVLEGWANGPGEDFRLGPERFRQRLWWQEAVNTPLAELEQAGREELRRLQSEWQQVAARIAPGQNPRAVMAAIGRLHPPADRLLAETRAVLGELRQFCIAHELVTIPDAPDPAVVETPGFLRAITFASIDPPGPFELEATEAYYQVTLPDPLWPVEQQEDHLEGYNPWGIRIISAHEVYPGHYVQYLHLPRATSTVRKVFASGAFVEGWAHYCEELLWEAGFRTEDPDRLRLVQVMEALERVGRYLVALGMHCHGMDVEEATAFFQRECFMAPVNARREALRGTVDPLYLIYTLGKLTILRLRERARAAWGAQFSLRRFHDELLGHGFPLLPVVEALMLGS